MQKVNIYHRLEYK